MPISEISKKLGFFDASHFHRIFKSLKASHQNNFKHVPKISFMIKQNIKNNLKLSCYPTQLPIPYSRQDTEQKPLSRGLFSLTFYASFFEKSAKRCEITQKIGYCYPFKI